MARCCESCGKPLSGRADQRTCGATCRQRLRRQRAVRAESWQSIAHRLELDAPERWAAAPARIVYRDVDDDELLRELSDDDELFGDVL
jgi:hypothetical protein